MYSIIHRAARSIFVLCLLLLVSACHSGLPWATKSITGLMPNLSFSLTDANRDTTVQAKDFHGRIVVVYFGYTHCPDVCPLMLHQLQSVLSKLGEKAEQVRVLFVTVDPKRDTVPVLKSYSEYFGPQFIGLRGDETALRKLTKTYRVTYGYGKPDAQGNYEVSHSSAAYIFDRKGDARLIIRPTDSVAAVTTDLQRLLAEGQQAPGKN
jgi:protein SCO1/2